MFPGNRFVRRPWRFQGLAWYIAVSFFPHLDQYQQHPCASTSSFWNTDSLECSQPTAQRICPASHILKVMLVFYPLLFWVTFWLLQIWKKERKGQETAMEIGVIGFFPWNVPASAAFTATLAVSAWGTPRFVQLMDLLHSGFRAFWPGGGGPL